MTLGFVLVFAAKVWGDSGTRQSIDLDAATLDALVGKYQLAPQQILSIIRFRTRLFARMRDEKPFAICAESETAFFNNGGEDPEVLITFEKDAQGRVTAARFDQGRRTRRARRSPTTRTTSSRLRRSTTARGWRRR